MDDLHGPRTGESGSSRGANGFQMSLAEVLNGKFVRNEFCLVEVGEGYGGSRQLELRQLAKRTDRWLGTPVHAVHGQDHPGLSGGTLYFNLGFTL